MSISLRFAPMPGARLASLGVCGAGVCGVTSDPSIETLRESIAGQRVVGRRFVDAVLDLLDRALRSLRKSRRCAAELRVAADTAVARCERLHADLAALADAGEHHTELAGPAPAFRAALDRAWETLGPEVRLRFRRARGCATRGAAFAATEPPEADLCEGCR